MFTFLNEMETVEENWRNSNYDISGQQLNINAYTEVGLGLSRQINNRLTVGARVKALLGIGNMELKLNKVAMNANLPSDARINQLQDPAYLSSLGVDDITKLRSEIEGYHANLAVDAHLESSFKGLNLKRKMDRIILVISNLRAKTWESQVTASVLTWERLTRLWII